MLQAEALLVLTRRRHKQDATRLCFFVVLPCATYPEAASAASFAAAAANHHLAAPLVKSSCW